MSVPRSALRLWGRRLVSGDLQRRSATTGPPPPQRRTRFRNAMAEKLGLYDPEKLKKYRQEKFPDYSKEDLEALEKMYTPEQMDAIKAGEEAVDPDDMIFQGRLRDDMFRLKYVEDFTRMDPRFDIKPEDGVKSVPQEVRWLNDSEWLDNYGSQLLGLSFDRERVRVEKALIRALKRVKQSEGDDGIDLTVEELKDLEQDPSKLREYLSRTEKQVEASAKAADDQFHERWRQMHKRWVEEVTKEFDKLDKQDDDVNWDGGATAEPSSRELMEIGPDGLDRLHSAEAPELGKIPGVVGKYKSIPIAEDEGDDESGALEELKRLSGMTSQQIESLYCKVLVRRFVVNQTRLGKVRSLSVMAIAGNGNGWLGLGIAKSTEMGLAMDTAQMLAIRNMKPIRRYENRTIFGKVKAKISGTVVELFTKPPGWGLRCPHRIFEMCRASGLHDIAAKMPRSKNPMNSVKATYQALMNQPDPERMAIGRGKKMVDVRKVYYGGSVY
ncbi:hypothetical protein L249_2229 [Ophiocordyceps polyrhachis-furcata BCC 54312]|uniref:Small ribosomal subunit protein uS5m n=1 Tax=Ophiocordyceps polyrhachis-furcata BCC 54312 TaxID=1330021 RepID=A0A367LMV9_9HYPO|nr:hypothetical protein L249_2229 [Ophiocordyceps polyrhachis-furcata BCC 54312]